MKHNYSKIKPNKSLLLSQSNFHKIKKFEGNLIYFDNQGLLIDNRSKNKNKENIRQNNFFENENNNNNYETEEYQKVKNDIFFSLNKTLNTKDIFKTPIRNEKRQKNILNQTFELDITNNNIYKTNEKTFKIKLKKIYRNIRIFENLKYIELNDIPSLFSSWELTSNIYKSFEEKLRENDFEIDKKTLKIITKNPEAYKLLNNQKFWILYIEYLINNNLLLNEEQFISVINEAFKYIYDNKKKIENQFNLLKDYYLKKIKIYSPQFLPNGDLDNNEEIYINKLDKHAIRYINNNNLIE